MIDDDRTTAPVMGSVLVSYALGELDAEEATALEKKLETAPALREELEEIRSHLTLHEEIRKVAPRRGSFERLHARMKREGAFDGAVPGAHCMARRSFIAAMIFGLVAVALLAVFTRHRGAYTPAEQIGQIVYHNPSQALGQRREAVSNDYLVLFDDSDPQNERGRYSTGDKDAFIWLTTGQPKVYSSLEITTKSEFRFTAPRRMVLDRGEIRRLDARPGTISEGPFIVVTPHGMIQAEDAGLAVKVTEDEAQTHVSVSEGTARVFGRNSETPFQVTAGYCTTIERGKLPAQERPMLALHINGDPGNKYVLQATLKNNGYVPVKVSRAANPEPVYLLHVRYPSSFDKGMGPENTTLPPQRVTPMPQTGEAPDAHRGEVWLKEGEKYTFSFDASTFLIGGGAAEYWLALEYRGDLYAPQGQPRVKIHSANWRLEERDK